MAKTESTAVNELINLVQTATPLKPDPSEDLMFKAPAKKVSPPRVAQTTIPPVKGAGEVAPLPRQRAPQGTQGGGVPVVGARPTMRMSTAPASPAMSIPPIKPWTGPEGTSERDALADDARPTPVKLDGRTTKAALPPPAPVDPRATRPSLPLPARKSAPPMPAMPPIPAPRASISRTEAPPQTPVAAPFETPAKTPDMPHGYPSAAPYLAAHVGPDMTSHQAWFDQSAGFSQPVEVVQISDTGTAPVRKATDWKTLIPKLIMPTILLIVLGIFVGGYFAFDDASSRRKAAAKQPDVTITATAPVATPKAEEPKAVTAEAPKAEEARVVEPKTEAPKAEAPKAEEPKAEEPKAVTAEAPKTEETPVAPKPELAARTAPEPRAAPAVVTAGKPTFVDIRIDSTPSGATVMLVDRGKTAFLGTTPISTAIDPSRQYDLVFTYANKPTVIEHLDPSKTKKVSVTLGGKKETAKTAVARTVEPPKAEAPKKVEAPKRVEAPKKVEAPKVVEAPKKVEAPKAEAPTETKAPPAAPAGEGVLMVSSKPPTEIYVNGTPTGLSTPQRAMKLPVGKHRITLVNEAEKIRKTIPITITADQPTKLIENFMK